MRRPIFWPLLLIGIGIVFLLSNFGVLAIDVWELWRFWPVILIVIGLDILWSWLRRGQGTDIETLSLDLDGLTEAEVSIEYGAGQLRIDSSPAPDKLMEGDFSGGVDYRLRGNKLKLKMPPDMWFWNWHVERKWAIRLTRDIPLQVRVQTGASQANLDLGDLRVTDLRIESGAAETTVHLPRAAGFTRVHIGTGAASSKLFVPEGVAARIKSTMALGTCRINEKRFERSGVEYISPDYVSAANKLDISIEGGVGEVWVE